MLNVAVLDLRRESSWDPGRLTADAFRWPADAPAALLRELATRLSPRSSADEGAAVITPASIDPLTGALRRRTQRYQGAVYQVGAELRPGDLLLPRRPDGTVVRISEHLQGALFTSTFMAIRALDDSTSLWTWGVLNSVSGRQMRSAYAAGSVTASLTSATLMDLPIPLCPPLASPVFDHLRQVERDTRLPEEEAVETWWRTTDLRGQEWRLMLSTPEPELLEQGESLSNFCSSILRGRNVRPVAVESEEVGFLPVMDIGMLSGRPPRRWVPAESHGLIRIDVGDVVLGAVGERAHANVAREPAVADQNVFVLRLHDVSQADAVAQYLNGQQGFAMRRMLLSGMVIPSLRKSDLVRFPIQLDLVGGLGEAAPSVPLASRLEQLLWTG